MRIKRNLTICAFVLLGSLWTASASAHPGSAAPRWESPGCLRDAAGAARSEACAVPATSTPTLVQHRASTCAGALLCGASWAELRDAGFDTNLMQQEETAEETKLSQGVRGMPAFWTGDFGFNDFYLYAADRSCQGTVTANGFCAWLINHVTPYVQGEPKPTKNTVLPGRSGDNVPSHHWIKNVGPLPNGDWQSSSPSLAHFHWGYHNGSMTGFESSTDDHYYPGFFRLDPTMVWSGSSRTGTERDNMLIHGGRNSHDFWTTGTSGCIRLPVPSMNTLASLWSNLTDNKGWGAGPDNYVHFSHA